MDNKYEALIIVKGKPEVFNVYSHSMNDAKAQAYNNALANAGLTVGRMNKSVEIVTIKKEDDD